MVQRTIKWCILLLAFGVTSFNTGCYYDVEDELYPVEAFDPSKITYTNDVAPVINSSCAISGCHVDGGIGTAKNIKLNTYESLSAQVNSGAFRREVIVDQTMPPNISLDPVVLQKIEIWLNNGAQNN